MTECYRGNAVPGKLTSNHSTAGPIATNGALERNWTDVMQIEEPLL
jgi:hypothetical protein